MICIPTEFVIVAGGLAFIGFSLWRWKRAIHPWGKDRPCEHGARHPSVCGECRAEQESIR